MSTSSNQSQSTPQKPIFFGPYEVTNEVFHTTSLSFALVNIKPILPGHVLVIPFRKVQRLTDLSGEEVGDLFEVVRRVQGMLGGVYFKAGEDGKMGGSFNVALQDGPEAGQTVPHVHVHIIPRPSTGPSTTLGDQIYAKLQGDEGNVGGGLWDERQSERPVQGGKFPEIKDEDRKPRGKEEMRKEAEYFKGLMGKLDGEGVEAKR